jgi:hypothetical protein
MTFNCEFCNKTYSSKNNLNLHQTTAKFCLEIQAKQKQTSNKNERKIYSCNYCQKNYTQNKSLMKHLEHCSKKVDEIESIENLKNELLLYQEQIHQLNKIISEQNQQIAQMKAEKENLKFEKFDMELKLKNDQINFLKEIKSTPSITNNTNHTNNYNSSSQSTKISNVTNNVNKLQLTEDFLTKLRNGISFKDQVFLDEEDICRWTLKNGLNNYFAVLDKSRKVLTFTDEKGNKIRDQDGVLLANKLYKEFCETIKKEQAQEFLNGLEENPDEMYIPTTLMRRKKLVQNVINGNEHSVQKLGCSIFKEYPRYEPKKTEQLNNMPKKEITLIEQKETLKDEFEVKNFSIVISKIKNLFYKYNFDPLNYGLHTIGGFIYQFLAELEIIASDENEWVEIKDDFNVYHKLNDKQLFNLFRNIFTEEDLIQIVLKCNTEEYSKNLIIFQKVFILGQTEGLEIIDSIIENLFLGLRGAF